MEFYSGNLKTAALTAKGNRLKKKLNILSVMNMKVMSKGTKIQSWKGHL